MQENQILQNNQRAAFCVAGGNANLSFNFIWPMRMIFNVQCNLFNRLKRTLPLGPDPVHLFAENFDVEMWNSDRIMEIDGKFRNKPFCCIKGPKCGSSHFFYT
jgi:hypothetical protein